MGGKGSILCPVLRGGNAWRNWVIICQSYYQSKSADTFPAARINGIAEIYFCSKLHCLFHQSMTKGSINYNRNKLQSLCNIQ